MLRRWIIRALFSLPVLLCMAGWFWSTNHAFYIRYDQGHSELNCGTEWGAIFINQARVTLPVPNGWDWGTATLQRLWQPPASAGCYNFLGFSFGWFPEYHGITVPYWFLTLAFAALLCFAWRKTAARPTPSGFPVQPPG